MPYVREASDLENPAIAKMGAPKVKDPTDPESSKCGCGLLRRGWFWACLICVVVVCVVTPIGVRTTKRLNDPVMDTPRYTFNGTGLNTSVPDMFDAGAWADAGAAGAAPGANGSISCSRVQPDLPAIAVPTGTPPPALKVAGPQLVTVAGNKPVELHGVNWFGFNNGKTFVDGLDAEKKASWEGGDFATVVYTLRLLGFNAVRLPFLFNELYHLPPHDYSKPCPAVVPTTAQLAARASNPETPVKPNAQVPYEFVTPEGFTPGRCNAYVPNGPTTLSRYLWTVQYLVASGFYVLVDYHPHAEGEPLLNSADSVDEYVDAWQRLWTSLTCLPNWESGLRGRVFLDLLNEPDALQITWDGSASTKPPLSKYYLGVMDAINCQSPGEALFFIQGGGQDRLGTSWGDGFATDPKWIAQRALADANGFFQALAAKSYAGQVVLAPHLYGVSVSKTPDVGDLQWQKYATSFAYLQRDGYCNGTASCRKYPVVAGEIGSKFKDPRDVAYYNDMAAFFRKEPPTEKYNSVPFNSWFYWSWNANSGDTGGLVADDWQTLQWNKLGWLEENLGLKPWHAVAASG